MWASYYIVNFNILKIFFILFIIYFYLIKIKYNLKLIIIFKFFDKMLFKILTKLIYFKLL